MPTPTPCTRIGILGGSGPEAGGDLFRKVLAAHRAALGAGYRGDMDAPDILLSQVSGIGGGTMAERWPPLAAAVVEIAPLVCCFSVACNALHRFEPDIRQLLTQLGEPPAKFVSMTAATTAHCQWAGPASIALLGGEAVMEMQPGGSSPYLSLAAAMGQATIWPLNVVQRGRLAAVILAVKADGAPAPDEPVTRELEALLRELEAASVEAVVLACTELPLVPVGALCAGEGRPPPAVQLVDPAELLAASCLSTWRKSC